MTADTRTITVEQFDEAVSHWMDMDTADAIFAALPAACCCIEGNDIMLTTCATNDCPEHGASEADRLLVALMDGIRMAFVGIEAEPTAGKALLQALDEVYAVPARAYIEQKGLA